MKAVVMHGVGDVRYEDVDTPHCPEGGLLLRVKAVGLCGSDIRNLTTDSRRGRYPHIYGHEHVGVVEEVCPSVSDFAKEDRIYIHPLAPCMRCDFCRAGQTNNCIDPDDYLERPGGFAEFVAVTKPQIDGRTLYKIPGGVEFKTATLGEPLTSVYGCQDNIDVKLGDTVVIIGGGPIGCFHATLAKLRGASSVIMIEINDARLRKTMEFGVDHAVNGNDENPVAAVKRLTGDIGADKVISANPSAAAQAESVYMAKKGGIVVLFGGVARGSKVELDTNHVHYNNIRLYGHYGANAIQSKRAFQLAISPGFPAKKFITHVMPLSQIREAMELMRSGEALKVILKP